MATSSEITVALQVRAIDPDALSQLRRRDDAGHPPRLMTDEDGGSPLRCCLRLSRAGERVALVSYAPLCRWARETGADPGPYDEVGPVFIHPAPCAGPDAAGYPPALTGRPRVFRAYSASGRILAGACRTRRDQGHGFGRGGPGRDFRRSGDRRRARPRGGMRLLHL